MRSAQQVSPCLGAKALAFVALAVGTLFVHSVMSRETGSGGINATDQLNKPYLILISLDGFRWDFRTLNETPALDQLSETGISAASLIPVYPTLTFPNHYSIATGLYPRNHGLVGNRFFNPDRSKKYALTDREAVQDGSWYSGVPIWVKAETHGMVSAAFFFVGTEADVGGVRPTHWRAFNARTPNQERVDQVVDWLTLPERDRPHLITLYFEDVDEATHRYGPGSRQSTSAIAQVDRQIGDLMSKVAGLPVAEEVYYLIVSDHGQAAFEDRVPFVLEDVVDISGANVVDHGSVAFVYLRKPSADLAAAFAATVNNHWKHGKAWLPENAPESWQLGTGEQFADIIVQADPGFAVVSSLSGHGQLSRGDHGWSPEFKQMHGIFIANGPRIPRGLELPSIEAVDIYPLMLEILQLPNDSRIDGDPEKLVSLIKDRVADPVE